MYVEQLVRDGFITIEGALDPDLCEATVRHRLDERNWNHRESWPIGPVHLPATTVNSLRECAPLAADALEHLVGGVDACKFSDIPDNLIINFPDPSAIAKTPIERARDPKGWHKDGDWFRHFLDSPEQGLLGIVLWRDVTPEMGPTLVASDSLGPMARLLASNPQGFAPGEMITEVADILAGCSDIRPLTGTQGTIVFAHPFLLHTASANTTDYLRIISNTSVMLRHPMRFDGPTSDRTDVERATLELLGVDHLAFAATSERGKVVSERERRWAAGRESGDGANRT